MPHKVQRKNHYAPRPGTAMREMNLTPFIDVLLVLLIMLILAMPVKFHVTEVPLPHGEPTPRLSIQSENTVHISADDALYWNGDALTADELRTQVAAASAQEDQPLLRFAPDPQASYNTSANVIALIKRQGAQKFAFIGNHQHKDFGKY